MTPPDSYWPIIAAAIDAEERRAACYLADEDRLDVARVAILRHALRRETPERYRVGTGVVLNAEVKPAVASGRCDVLVYERAPDQPFYEVDDFAVVPHAAARFAFEVCAVLNQASLNRVLAAYDGMRTLVPHGTRAPVFGVAYDGVPFDAFVNDVREATRANRLQLAPAQRFLNWPVAVGVHTQNYLALRPTAHLPNGTYWFAAIDFDQAVAPSPGHATANLFRLYHELLNGRQIEGPAFRAWFNELPIKPAGKLWLLPDGQLFRGNIA